MAVEPARTRAGLLTAKVRVPDHVVHRPFPTETVILNLDSGVYHGLNPVAGRMFEELERQETVGAAAAAVAEEYGQPLAEVEQDVSELCADLSRRGLLAFEPEMRP